MSEVRRCSVAGCDRPWFCRDWCQAHYHRFHRAGFPRQVHPCEMCGVVFDARGARGKLSVLCWDCRPNRKCEACGKIQYFSNAERFCVSCRPATSCVRCGVKIAATHRRMVCDACRGKPPPRTFPWSKWLSCPECSVWFVSDLATKRFCSSFCGRRSRRRGDVQKSHTRLRAARRRGASTGVPVVYAEIFARDGWVCQLCGGRVNRSLAWPDPQSPTVDHVVPLSQGGLHDPSNLQLAHARCNFQKSTKPMGEQLRLV